MKNNYNNDLSTATSMVKLTCNSRQRGYKMGLMGRQWNHNTLLHIF